MHAVFLILFKFAMNHIFHLQDKFQGFCCAKFPFLPADNEQMVYLSLPPPLPDTVTPLLLDVHLSG